MVRLNIRAKNNHSYRLSHPVSCNHIFVKRASIFWNFFNITKQCTCTVGSSTKTFRAGFWDIDDIEKQLGITIVKDTINGKCSITHGSNITLDKQVAKILGFNNTSLPSGTTHISDNMVDVYIGVKTVDIYCSVVERSYDPDGNRSQLLMSLPAIPTRYGTQIFRDVECKVQSNRLVVDTIDIEVLANGLDIGCEVLLEIYLY